MNFKKYSAMMWIEEFQKSQNQEALAQILEEAKKYEQGLLALIAYKKDKFFSRQIWSILSFSDKAFLIAFHPALADIFNDWHSLYAFNWIFILKRHFPLFENIAKNYTSGWAGIFAVKPELFGSNDAHKKFTKDDWVELLREQPSLINHCPCIEKFNKYDQSRLIRKHQNLSRIILNNKK